MNKYSFLILLALFSQIDTAYAESAHDNYRTYCMQCHGLAGDGMGVNIQDMSVQPRNHTDKKTMGTRTDTELFKVIKEGGLLSTNHLLCPLGQIT